MAEAFLVVVLKNLWSLIEEEIGLMMGVNEEMKKLSSTLTTIQAVLEDAEQRQLDSKPIRDWLRKINDLAYQIDDVLDECAIHVSKLKHTTTTTKFSRYSLKSILLRHNTGKRMKQIAEELDTVAAERVRFHLRAIETPRDVSVTRETGSLLGEPNRVFGREGDKEKIVDLLVNRARENQDLSVLPIIGVGGLGKTTLAQLVYNDQRVVRHFEERLWVCASDNVDLKGFIKAMVESSTGNGSASDLQHLDALQRRLWNLLNRKRYLLVLDDVWNDEQEKWFELRSILACGSSGASIIVTTRLKKVADIMATLPIHYLTGLSKEHCWRLLRQRAFGDQREENSNLEAIGKQIVNKCAGVPLAAKALGGVLRFKRTEDEWIHVRESEIWKLSPEEALIVPALRLSYHHLPLELRQCFAYWAVFPKNHSIEKEDLIFNWMAHGYISSKGMLEVEDVGYEVCNELVLRSLLHVNDLGELHMHDLVHDLAQSIMENKVPGKQVEQNVAYTKIREANLRSRYVAFPRRVQHDMEMDSITRKFTRLRVLDAGLPSIKHLPREVTNLKHLRRLDLSRTEIRTLPNSVCSLWYLEILNLNLCMHLVALPKKLRFLKNLRHLYLENCKSLSETPPKIGEISGLRTLSLYIVGKGRGNQLEELQFLSLGGTLEIQHLERVENHADAKKSNLATKKNVRDLRLGWKSNGVTDSRVEVDEEVFEALEPHPTIQCLTIRGFSGRHLPAWMTNTTLQKVYYIGIVNCVNCRRLPKLGELPHLKFLVLEKVGVEYIIEDEVEGGNEEKKLFTSLNTLVLQSLPNLRGFLKEGFVKELAFPKLESLKIESCVSSFILPQLPSLNSLKAVNCGIITLASLSVVTTLASLNVRIDDEKMTRFLVEMLQKLRLRTLEVSTPAELPVLRGMRGFRSLKELYIVKSETLRCIPEGWFGNLNSLEELHIYDCQEFVDLPDDMKYLHNLRSVRLSYLPKMVCLPEALRHLSSLHHLSISSLLELNSLPDWLHHLTSLRLLHVHSCPKVERLPTCIQEMINLQYLTIGECSGLARPCERGTGEDWPKIAHIPHLSIGI